MKKMLTILLLSTALSWAEPPKLAVATVDMNALNQKLGYTTLRQLEYAPEIRSAYIELQAQLRDVEKRMVAAKDAEELEQVEAKLAFLNSKSKALTSMGGLLANSVEQKEQLTKLIAESFADKYPLILQQPSSTDPFRFALHSNIELVDITEDVANAVRCKLGIEPRPNKSE